MARMTALDMVTEARLALGGETTETISNNMLLRWLNRAYMNIASVYSPRELESSFSFTTTSGTAEYAAPTTGADDTLSIISMIDETNNVQMYPWDTYQYDRATQGDASSITGVPLYWYESGVGDNTDTPAKTVKQYTLYPTPGGTYTVNVKYIKKPTELVLSPSETSSVLREPWDEVMLYSAISKGWKLLGDMEKSAAWERAASNSSQVAAKSSFTPSYVPFTQGSIVGNAR